MKRYLRQSAEVFHLAAARLDPLFYATEVGDALEDLGTPLLLRLAAFNCKNLAVVLDVLGS